MENASKALLIAAAVLIVILLIVFGMRIFNSASPDVLEQTKSTGNNIESKTGQATIGALESIISADDEKITTQEDMNKNFEKKFGIYAGNNKTKNDIINLVNKIKSHNDTNNYYEVGFSMHTGSFQYTYESIDKLEARKDQLPDSSNYTIELDTYKINYNGRRYIKYVLIY